jgi:pectinacetylesterase
MPTRLAAQTGFAAIVVLASASAHAEADRIYWNGFEPAITAAPETWTWVPFDNAFCGNGSKTGIGVNLTSASGRLLIYLQEGGACWNAFTCSVGLADNFTTGYGPTKFATDVADTSYLALQGGFFDRSAVANPFKDYSYVFVPYCTGDTHSGSNITSFGSLPAYFVGFRNIRAYLERLAVTFPGADRIVLAGSSAGGFGATLNWWQTAQAFPGVRVDMIDDSGAIMPNDVLPSPNTEQDAQRVAWNLAATTPPGCTGCATAFDAIYSFDSSTFPNSRGALLSYRADSVLPLFYGISTQKFTQGLSETETQFFDPSANLRYFNASGSGHVLWFSPSLSTQSTTVLQFITLMVTDDPGWGSVTP